MKFWIILLIAGLLLLWGLSRERFEATPSIQAPPYGNDETVRIYGMLPSADMATLMAKATAANPTIVSDSSLSAEAKDRRLRIAAGAFLTPVIGEFFTTVFRPATTLLTQANIDTFFAGRPASDIRDIEKKAVKIYFLDQSGVGTSAASGYAAVLSGLGQGVGYMYNSPTGGTGPAGAGAAAAGATGAGAAGATGAAAAGAAGAGATGATGAAGAAAAGPEAGGTTGGSSTNEASPNAGPVGSTGKGKELYGPVFTSLGGVPPRNNGQDSSTTNRYPELMGGMGDTTSVRTPQGMRNPSQNWLLSQSGALPSTASLGSDANSGYLPYSRVPGDQDLIPDPYRLSRNYSTASYSSKTDPVPFLTDFSAFSK